jgi:N-acetylmuramoyl-L-alanine amidase
MSASPNNPRTGSANLNHLSGDAPAISNFPRSDHRDLENLLALSSLHEQIRRRRAQELNKGARLSPEDAWELKQLVHDEVLQLVADRALIVTGADGVAVALVDGSGIVCRAAAGTIAPGKGTRLDPYSGFSGACLRTGEIVRCDDSEKDQRVSPEACRRLGTRSMVAVPLATPLAILGVLEVFSTEPFGFNDSDVRSLTILSELILDAMKPEQENQLAEISRHVVGSPTPIKAAQSDVPEMVPDPTFFAIKKRGLLDDRDVPVRPAADRDNSRREVDKPREHTRLVLFPESDHFESSRPGLRVVIFLMILAVALGAGLWWQIRHDSALKSAELKVSKSVSAPTPVPQMAPAQSNLPVTEEDPSVGGEAAPTQAMDKLPEITGIRHWSSDDSSTVAIDLQDQVQYEAHRLTSPERIYVDLLDTGLAHGLFGKVIEVSDPVLQRIRIAQPKPGVTRVVLDTKGASNYSVSMEQSPFRLVVEVGKLGSKVGPRSKLNLFGPAQGDPKPVLARNTGGNSSTKAPAPPQSSADKSGQAFAPPVGASPAGLSIVLDAGHGGWDFGTVGRKGLLEKDLVLDIVQRLGALLEQRLNAKVIYTRQDDSYIALERRAEIANLSQANLFISVHANYSDLATARGVETYYTNTYSSLKARPADEDADSSLQNVDWTKVDIREKVLESHHLAECVQQALYGTVAEKNPGIRNRGVKEAEYAVLTGTSMPAILAEVSFVSSPTDEGELQNEAYRQRIAEALYKGIARYHDTPRHATMASLVGKADSR